jgi:hypothetical protein
MSGMPFATKQAQIPRHWDSAKCGDILVQCKVAHFEDLVLDFSVTHPRSGSSTLHPVGSWKLMLSPISLSLKTENAAIPYEQANHAFLSLTADTYGKLSDDFVRFLWMLANSASTNAMFSSLSAIIPRLRRSVA